MDREANIELIHYRALNDWVPKIGDIVIKHGWIQRTKWFGVVNFMHPDGNMQVVCDGMMRLLVTTRPEEMQSKVKIIDPNEIKSSVAGSYSVMQQDKATNAPIWYI